MGEKRRILVAVEVNLMEVQNTLFEDKVIKTNGFHFVGCRFVRCTLWGDQAISLLDCCYFVDCVMLDVEPASLGAVN